jgi:hypothetical protein
MMNRAIAMVSALALTVSQLGTAVPALAQQQPADMQPMARPVPTERPAPPVVTRPAPPAINPGAGNNNGGNNGGNRPPIGGGAGDNGGNRPPFGGSGGTSGGNRPPIGGGAGWNGGNNRPPIGGGAGWNGGSNRPPIGGGAGWNGIIVRCESWQYRYQECGANTRGGVQLRNVIAGDCNRRNWGWRGNVIWVNNGCRADFAVNYGGGGGYPPPRDDGPSAGAVIGGVAVAAGLIALLAAASKKSSPAPAATAPSPAPVTGGGGPPARVNVELGGITPDARPAMTLCLAEAARQIGATGGREIAMDRIDDIEKGNGGYRIRMNLKGIYPDESRVIPTFCRATSTKVIELTFG